MGGIIFEESVEFIELGKGKDIPVPGRGGP
jgi:hypothetical protein